MGTNFNEILIETENKTKQKQTPLFQGIYSIYTSMLDEFHVKNHVYLSIVYQSMWKRMTINMPLQDIYALHIPKQSKKFFVSYT